MQDIGGADSGATSTNEKYSESELTIEFAKDVKEELEKLGLKVKLTRDGTEGKEWNVYSIYNEDGRVNIVGKSKAKYVISIHLNSIDEANSQSGVEIYAPSNMNLSMARLFASNIVKYANTRYSGLDINYRKENGVYVRTYTEEQIAESAKTAKEKRLCTI